MKVALARWYDAEHRAMPWRDTCDPYRIWLSEIILQQTRVEQGMAYYCRFIEAYPDVFALAAASEDEVLKYWQGLGYYSRARNLRNAAFIVVNRYGGLFPKTMQELRTLPGVGPYTAAAILSFAYNLPYAAVDGNVMRVLSRLFLEKTPIGTGRERVVFENLAADLLDSVHPARHNNAMMELGAVICTPLKPACADCPVAGYCGACRLGVVSEFPKRVVKAPLRERHFLFADVRDELSGRRLMCRRAGGDIWQGLYQPPLVELQALPETEGEAVSRIRAMGLLLPGMPVRCRLGKPRRHLLTHQRIDSVMLHLVAEFPSRFSPLRGYSWYTYEEAEAFAVPRLVSLLLDGNNRDTL